MKISADLGSTIASVDQRQLEQYYLTLTIDTTEWTRESVHTLHLYTILNNTLADSWEGKIISQTFNGDDIEGTFTIINLTSEDGTVVPMLTWNTDLLHIYTGIYRIVVGVETCAGNPCTDLDECIVACNTTNAAGINFCSGLEATWQHLKDFGSYNNFVTETIPYTVTLKISNRVLVSAQPLVSPNPVVTITLQNVGDPVFDYCLDLTQLNAGVISSIDDPTNTFALVGEKLRLQQGVQWEGDIPVTVTVYTERPAENIPRLMIATISPGHSQFFRIDHILSVRRNIPFEWNI